MMWEPFAARLRTELDALAKLSHELLDASSIRDDRNINDDSQVIFIAPSFAWASPTTELRRLQLKLVPRFDRWSERCNLVFADAPQELRDKLEEKIGQIKDWLARDGRAGGWGSGWDIPQTIAAAKVKQAERFADLRALLDIVAPTWGPDRSSQSRTRTP